MAAPIILAPVAPETVDADTFTIRGTTVPGAFFRVWIDANANGRRDPGEAQVGSHALGRGGREFAIVVPLAQDADN